MKVWATFRGYSGTFRTKSFNRKYTDDEWLCNLYFTEGMARAAVEEFGEGKAFDNPLENQITRFYEGGKTIFEHGAETEKLVPGGYSEWMRYAPLWVQEPDEQSTYRF